MTARVPSILILAATASLMACRTPSTVTHSTGREAQQVVEQRLQPDVKPVPATGPYEEDLTLAKKQDFLTLVQGGVPDELKNTIEIRDYKFENTRIEELPEVRLEVFNLLDEQPVSFEIRTLFFRKDSTVFDATEWVRATAPPRGSYRYRAIAWSPYAASEQVQIRLLDAGQGNNS